MTGDLPALISWNLRIYGN